MTKSASSETKGTCYFSNTLVIKGLTCLIHAERYPLWAALSFVVVLVAIGIPVWWQTTTVKRAPLPIDEIEELDFEGSCARSMKVLFKSYYDEGSLFCDMSSKLFPETMSSKKTFLFSDLKLDNQFLFNFVVVHKLCRPFSGKEVDIIDAARSVEEADEKLLSLQIEDHHQYDVIFFETRFKDQSRPGHIVQGKGKYVYINNDIGKLKIQDKNKETA